MFKNFLILTFKGIRYRPVRSWLTILGIIIGIMLVVIILSLGSGIQSAVTRTLQMFGSNLVIIFPGKETNPFLGFAGGQKFRESDLLAFQNIEGVEAVVPANISTLTVDYRGEKQSVFIHGADWRGLRIILERSQGIKLVAGDWPESDSASEAILGYLTATKLFKNKISVGDDIIIKSKRVKVAGIFSEIGVSGDDNSIYVSNTLLSQITGQSRDWSATADVVVADNANVNFVAEQIKSQLKKQDVVHDFAVLTPDTASRLVGNILSIIEFVLVVIALISLIVGAVGIMNTMYTSVLERTKQIGIMKAIGASSEAILSLFLIESGTIGLTGGFLGIIFGLVAAFFVSLIAGYFGIGGLFSLASLDYLGLLVILFITFATGVLAGILPARQAANLEPAEALRYE